MFLNLFKCVSAVEKALQILDNVFVLWFSPHSDLRDRRKGVTLCHRLKDTYVVQNNITTLNGNKNKEQIVHSQLNHTEFWF